MTVGQRFALFSAFLMIVVAIGGDALAWGDLGHKVICEIALRQVSAVTRAEIDKLIQTDAEYTSFTDACSWADHPRKRAAEHFLNLARNSQGLTAQDCPGASVCVISAIRKDFALLSSKTTSQADRLVALKFIAHWVGDVHQPLHVSFEDDRGGNRIRIAGKCPSNLHSAWDTCLVHYAVGDNADAAASELLRSITSSQTQAWARASLRDWANESFAISRSHGTHYCALTDGSCQPIHSPLIVDDAYIAANVPVLREQLAKAGVRLAHVLDQALATSSP
jgi:hypothetical protein